MCVEEDHQLIRCVTLLVTYPLIEGILGAESKSPEWVTLTQLRC